MDTYRLRQLEELPAIHHGAVKLAGDALGVQSFGLQAFDWPAGFTDYPEHDHADDGQEEVYVVLHGSVEFEVAGESVSAGSGSLLWVSPQARRRLTPGPAGVQILAIGSVPGGAYERPDGFRLAARS